jgi:hypothetical protein
MKQIAKNLTYVLIGLGVSLAAYSINAAWNTYVTTGNTLTDVLWNDLVKQVEDISTCSNTSIMTPTNNTIYQNTGKHKLMVTAWVGATAAGHDLTGYIGATNPPATISASDSSATSGASRRSITFVVPIGWYYKVADTSGSFGGASVWEMCGI